MTISDSIQEVAGRFYVQATATITNEDGQSVSVQAYAREADSKSGMDSSQITGSCSSYARKYALNGLFLIDDTKDADTDEWRKTTNQEKQSAQQPKSPQPQQPTIQFSNFDTETELVAEQEMQKCNSYAELMAVWNKYHSVNPQYCRKDGPLSSAFVARNNEINHKK